MGKLLNSAEMRLKRLLRGSPLQRPAKRIKDHLDLARHSLSAMNDGFIRPNPKQLYVSLTANCNLRCQACHYGRDFMPGHQLPWSIGAPMIDDAAQLGFQSVRLYGGEPLTHKDVVKYVERIRLRGMNMWLTTNGVLLNKKIDALVAAGLSRVSIGFYGIGAAYDNYVQRDGAFARVVRSVDATRARHGPDALRMHLDWVLMRPTSDPDTVLSTLRFAKDRKMQVFVNLVHYSLPYFAVGEESEPFSFTENDRPRLNEAVEILLEAKREDPFLIRNSAHGLRSIPDWLILKQRMRVPCDAYEMVWVGPDGSVQMCYVTFRLGNLNTSRLKDLVFTPAHSRFARDAFRVNCPNCHCGYDRRVRAHAPSRQLYGP